MRVTKKLSNHKQSAQEEYDRKFKNSRFGRAASDVKGKISEKAGDIAEDVEVEFTTTDSVYVRVKVYFKDKIIGEYDIEEGDVEDFISYVKNISKDDENKDRDGLEK